MLVAEVFVVVVMVVGGGGGVGVDFTDVDGGGVASADVTELDGAEGELVDGAGVAGFRGVLPMDEEETCGGAGATVLCILAKHCDING